MKHYLFLLALPLLLFAGCLDDDAGGVNEEEVITEVEWLLTPTDATLPAVRCTFSDPDGDGGNLPTIDVDGNLMAGATYTGVLSLSNESEDIGAEVAEEDEEHQVFYCSSSPSLQIAYADFDDDGLPLGLLTTVVPAAAGTASVTIVLRHEPNKEAAGLAIDRPDLAGGETDVEVVFSLSIDQ